VLLALLPQGPAVAAGISITRVIDDLLPTLGASNLADLTWCLADGSEFYQWADEYAQRLGRSCGVFVERDATTAVVGGTAAYALPARHIDTIHVSLTPTAGTPGRLRPSSVAELYALDGTWPAASGVVARYSGDAGVPGIITLYRRPHAAGTLAVIFHQFPPAIAAASPTVDVASPVGDYFQYGMLAEARRKQGEGAMPEMAAHFDERVRLYEKVLLAYFGGAQ